MTYEVGPEHHGLRLDRFLKFYYKKRSREKIQATIDDGAVTLTRTQAPHLHAGNLKASTQVLSGDVIQVLIQKKAEPVVSFNYKVLYEDDALLVIDKPANLPVHPAGRYFFNSLLMHLKMSAAAQKPAAVSSEREFFLVHRIDKETSGVLLLSKTRESCAHVTNQFAERTTTKCYLAVVHGNTPSRFEVKEPLKRLEYSPIRVRMGVCNASDPEALASHTEFETLEHVGKFSLVRCYPHTGRQHQIRVHLEHAGNPIVGDKLYGMDVHQAYDYFEHKHISPEARARLIIPRHALHAESLEIVDPTTNQKRRFTSELPEDLKEFLNSQRRGLSTKAYSFIAGWDDVSEVKREPIRKTQIHSLLS